MHQSHPAGSGEVEVKYLPDFEALIERQASEGFDAIVILVQSNYTLSPEVAIVHSIDSSVRLAAILRVFLGRIESGDHDRSRFEVSGDDPVQH
jgi:hypothetical protein